LQQTLRHVARPQTAPHSIDARSAQTAKWILKQVQDDGWG